MTMTSQRWVDSMNPAHRDLMKDHKTSPAEALASATGTLSDVAPRHRTVATPSAKVRCDAHETSLDVDTSAATGVDKWTTAQPYAEVDFTGSRGACTVRS
jgi:hypothetical protein